MRLTAAYLDLEAWKARIMSADLLEKQILVM